jgi:hypothetical protein
MTKHVFILRREVYLGFYVVKFPMFQTYCWWANQMAPSRAKKIVGAPLH